MREVREVRQVRPTDSRHGRRPAGPTGCVSPWLVERYLEALAVGGPAGATAVSGGVARPLRSVTFVSGGLSLLVSRSLDRRLAGGGQKARAESVRKSVTGRPQRVQGIANAIDKSRTENTSMFFAGISVPSHQCHHKP